MTLAEKIAQLRKKAGWSQEELAERLSITRQAVSKWESAQASPDLERIVQLSELFNVTTDELLKDGKLLAAEPCPQEPSAEAPIFAQEEDQEKRPEKRETPCRRVTWEEAMSFLELRAQAAPRMALGVMLCVWSPVALIALAILQDYRYLSISDEVMAGAGLCALVLMVAAAVALFMTAGAKLTEYEFLEKEPIELTADALEVSKNAAHAFENSFVRCITLGVVLCIVSLLPLFAGVCVLEQNEFWAAFAVCPLLALVGAACYLFVYAGMIRGASDRLLEKGDYTRGKKARAKKTGAISAVYWLVVTAVFLFATFGPAGNGKPGSGGTWLIWAIGGVLYGALMIACEIYEKQKEE